MQVGKKCSSFLVFVASVFVYFNSLDGGFVFDDHRGILTNDDLDSSKTSLWDLLEHDFWGGSMGRVESHKSYRPLTVLTYRMNYYFAELHPWSYHVWNVLLHAYASLLFLSVCRLVLERGGGERVSVWSLFASLLFSVHSVHSEAVANAVGRAEVLSSIFFLSAFRSYARAIPVPNVSLDVRILFPSFGETRYFEDGTQWYYVFKTIIYSALSMLSKEQGVMALTVCAAYDVLLHWRILRHRLSLWKTSGPRAEGEEENSGIQYDSSGLVGGGEKHIGGKNRQKGSGMVRLRQVDSPEPEEETDTLRELIRRVGVLFVSSFLLLVFRLWMNCGTSPIFKPNELKAAFHPDGTVRMLSFCNIHTLNAWLLLSPSALCCDWSLDSVPLVTSMMDPRNIWSVLLYGGLAVLGLHVLRAKRDYFVVGTSVVLLVVPFLPASGVLLRVGFVIAERVLYLPSLGSCLLVSIGVRRLYYSVPSHWRCLITAAAISLIVILAAKTRHRNKDWASDLKLFESGVKVNPRNVKLHNNLGMELKSAGRIEEARYFYEKAMEIDPDYSEVYFNYGNLLFDDGDFQGAAVSFEKAVEYPQMYSKTLNNLATTYFRLGRWEEAKARFKESLRVSPDQPTTYNNLASLYGEMQMYRDSEKMFRKAIKLNPTYTEAYFNLGGVHLNVLKYGSKAKRDCALTVVYLNCSSGWPVVYLECIIGRYEPKSTLMVQMGRLDNAETYLKRALELDPSHHGAANNLRVVEHQRQRLSGF